VIGRSTLKWIQLGLTQSVHIGAELVGYFGHQERAGDFFVERVLQPLGDLASVLDVVAYHGFMPAEDSPGLRHLRTLFPPRQFEVEFPDGPQAGL